MIVKKNYIYIIVLSLVVIIGSIFIIKTTYSNFEGKNNSISKLFLKKLNSNDTINKIRKIQIDFNSEKFTLVKNHDDNWVLIERGNYPVVDQKVKELVCDLADLKIIEPKTTKPENFAVLQLEDIEVNKNVTRIILFDAEDKEIDGIYIGKREFLASVNADYQAHIFVRRPKENQAWLVAGKLPEGFALKDLVKQPLLSIDLATVLQVELTKAGQAQKSFIKIVRNATTKELNLMEVSPRFKVKEQYAVDNIVQQFGFLNYDDVILNSTDAFPVLHGKLILSQIKEEVPKEEHINFELVYINKNYYFKINNLIPNIPNASNWLYKISDYACQSLLINKSDLLTEVNKEPKNKDNKKIKK